MSIWRIISWLQIGFSLGLLLSWTIRIGENGWIANGQDLGKLLALSLILIGGIMTLVGSRR